MAGNDQHTLLNNIDNIQQFEALFNYATIGIVVTNSEGTIINFNRSAECQFGLTKEEAIGKKVEILLPAGAHRRHVNYRKNYMENPEPRIMGHGRDLQATRKDGSTFPVEVSLSHYLIKGETFVIAFIIDITVRKNHEAVALEQTHELEKITAEIKFMNAQLEQKVEDRTKMLREALSELERSKEELSQALDNEKELSELKSRFVTMASHEFRTPLSTILSSAYLLDKYNDQHKDPKVEKHISRIKNAVGGMKNILEDFLSLGKLEEGLVQTSLEKVTPETLDILVKELMQDLDGLVKTGQQINVNNLVDREVWIDRHLVKNILVNLVSNALKFTSDSGVIDVLCKTDANNLFIIVSDNGIGISEEDQQHLQERFFRARNASNIQGTGLGLHIVGKYLELLNGSISFTSRLNEGSTFTITIPQLQPRLT